AGFDLRGRAPRVVCVLHSVDLHAAPRHPDGEKERRDPDARADTTAVAATDEVLEDEPAPGTEQLVGADGVAARRARAVGVPAAEDERSRIYVAAFHVSERAARMGDGARREDPPWAS